MGAPGFESWWVSTFLKTKLWPNPDEMAEPIETVDVERFFRVEGPQEGYRVPVWDPRENRVVYIGVEAIGPVGTPAWADYAEDGRWIDVTLSIPQHLVAMQGDISVFRDLVTAGVQQKTKPGFYRIMRRVYNETMDSRTVPDATHPYLLKDVMYTQYFANDGSAIHQNWWASSWGYPASQGCLGMRTAGAKFMWGFLLRGARRHHEAVAAWCPAVAARHPTHGCQIEADGSERGGGAGPLARVAGLIGRQRIVH